MKNLKDDILNKIKSGEVDMKPHWHFVLKSLLLLLGASVTFLLMVYMLSFIHFYLRQSGIGFVHMYGFKGLSLFVLSSPWILIASTGSLVVVTQILTRKYSCSFRRPLLYSLVVIIIAALFGAYIVGRTQVHSRLQGVAEDRGMPLLGPLYRGIGEGRPESITFGMITEMKENGFILESDRGEVVTIVLTSETRQPPEKEFAEGDTVLVFGDREGGAVTAIGVRLAPPDFNGKRRGRPGLRNGDRPEESPAGRG